MLINWWELFEMRKAQLTIVQTSPTCVAYRLAEPDTGKIIWRNRIDPSDSGHAGARERMAAWCVAHEVEVIETQPLPQAMVNDEVEDWA